MGVPRTLRTIRIFFAVTVLLTCAAKANAVCTGPQELTAKLHAHPTTQNAVALGNWFAAHKQFPCALETFRAALKSDPKSAELHYLTGLALLSTGKPGEAVPEIQQAAQLQPGVLKPHLLLGILYDQANQHDRAEDEWKAALKIDPRSEPALEGLSLDLLAQQDYIGVISLLRDAPRTEKLAINLAKALGDLNYLDEAKAVLGEALKASPNSVPLASAMTVVLVKQIRYQEAIDLLQNTYQANPGNQQAELELFRLLVLTNHINLARPMGPKLLAERPHDPEVLYLNGIVERIVGDYPLAKAHLEEAVSLEGDFFNSRYNLGMVLVFLKEWKEAADQLQKAIDLGATEPQVHFELAKALRGLGEEDKALAEMQKYQALKKDEEAKLEAASAAAQGDTELAASKLQEAIKHYRDAVAGEPSNPGYQYKLALALRQDGDTAGERAALEETIRLNPAHAGAQRELGYLLAHTGDSAGAIEHFRLAVKAAPAWTEAWINLAGELAESGQFADARAAAATALRLDPNNSDAKELNDQLARDPNAQQNNP